MITTLKFERNAIGPSECIYGAWELVKGRLLLYIGASLVFFLISFIPYVSILLTAPFMGGFVYLVLKDMRSEPVTFGMLFEGFKRFLPLAALGLIHAVPWMIMMLIQYMGLIASFLSQEPHDPNFFQSAAADNPAFVGMSAYLVIFVIGYWLFSVLWSLTLTFAIPLIIDTGIGVIEAVKTSVNAVFANIGGLILLGLLGGLVALLGVMALCIGLVVAMPVIMAAQVFAYRQVFPLLDDSGEFVRPRNPYSIFES